MTSLPKTHPLYGAVESICDVILHARFGRSMDWFRKNQGQASVAKVEAQAADIIRALESAGYKVVGPESIGTMASAVPNPFVRKSMVEDMLSAAIAAAPTITGTEKGHG